MRYLLAVAVVALASGTEAAKPKRIASAHGATWTASLLEIERTRRDDGDEAYTFALVVTVGKSSTTTTVKGVATSYYAITPTLAAVHAVGKDLLVLTRPIEDHDGAIEVVVFDPGEGGSLRALLRGAYLGADGNCRTQARASVVPLTADGDRLAWRYAWPIEAKGRCSTQWDHAEITYRWTGICFAEEPNQDPDHRRRLELSNWRCNAPRE